MMYQLLLILMLLQKSIMKKNVFEFEIRKLTAECEWLLHAGGGIPCRPHPAATQLVHYEGRNNPRKTTDKKTETYTDFRWPQAILPVLTISASQISVLIVTLAWQNFQRHYTAGNILNCKKALKCYLHSLKCCHYRNRNSTHVIQHLSSSLVINILLLLLLAFSGPWFTE